MSDDAAFQQDLADLGFRLAQDRGVGNATFVMQATPYLTYSVHWDMNKHDVLFTWELAIGEYFSANGLQIGANEELNQFLFPKFDAHGAQDIGFVAAEMDRVEHILRSVDLLGG